MSTLTFPTIAEQVAEEFRASTRTVSVATIARKRGATVERKWDHTGLCTTYVFEDDTTLEVRGRGKAHRMITHLP